MSRSTAVIADTSHSAQTPGCILPGGCLIRRAVSARSRHQRRARNTPDDARAAVATSSLPAVGPAPACGRPETVPTCVGWDVDARTVLTAFGVAVGVAVLLVAVAVLVGVCVGVVGVDVLVGVTVAVAVNVLVNVGVAVYWSGSSCSGKASSMRPRNALVGREGAVRSERHQRARRRVLERQ